MVGCATLSLSMVLGLVMWQRGKGKPEGINWCVLVSRVPQVGKYNGLDLGQLRRLRYELLVCTRKLSSISKN